MTDISPDCLIPHYHPSLAISSDRHPAHFTIPLIAHLFLDTLHYTLLVDNPTSFPVDLYSSLVTSSHTYPFAPTPLTHIPFSVASNPLGNRRLSLATSKSPNNLTNRLPSPAASPLHTYWQTSLPGCFAPTDSLSLLVISPFCWQTSQPVQTSSFHFWAIVTFGLPCIEPDPCMKKKAK